MKHVLRKTTLLFVCFLLCSLLTSVAGFAGSFFLKGLIDQAFAGQVQSDSLIGCLVSFAANILLLYVCASLSAVYLRTTNTNLKTFFAQALFHKDIRSLQSENSHLYISAFTNDLATVEDSILRVRLTIVENLFEFVAGIAMALYISPWILLLIVLASGMQMMGSALLSPRIQREQNRKSKLLGGYTTYIKEIMSAFHIIKSNNLAQKITRDHAAKARQVQNQNHAIEKTVTLTVTIQNIVSHLLMIGMISTVGWMTIQGNVTVGGFYLVLEMIGRLIHPLSLMLEGIAKEQKGRAVFRRIDALITQHNDTENGAADPEAVEDRSRRLASHGENVHHMKRGLSLHDLDFSYEAERAVFAGANAVFERGKKYLVIGPSGGGKSTLLRLIRRYFEPNGGQILLDGVNINTFQRESYFGLFSYVEQNIFVFEDTVRNNITLYKNYTEEEIMRAVDRAGLSAFIASNAEGLEYRILDGGKNISGGERSRIAVARGLLAQSQIILLDEAFSSLHAGVARDIESTLLQLDDVTVINVSHVVFDDTKSLYDTVYCVAEGKITPVRHGASRCGERQR